MTSCQQRVIKASIIGYWFRINVKLELSIEDIAKIIIKFADEYEEFDPALSHPKLLHDNNLLILDKTNQKNQSRC